MFVGRKQLPNLTYIKTRQREPDDNEDTIQVSKIRLILLGVTEGVVEYDIVIQICGYDWPIEDFNARIIGCRHCEASSEVFFLNPANGQLSAPADM